MAQVLCFGNLQFDVLCRPVSRLPEPGTLECIEEISPMLSGNAGNVAAVLGRLGLSVDVAGFRGADLLGEGLAITLDRLGVGSSRLLYHPSAGTGISVIAVAPDGERTILFVNGANALFELDTVPENWLEGTSIVSVGSLYTLPQFTGAAVGRLLARARRHGAITVLNCGWPPEIDGLLSIGPALEEADYFILSNLEGGRLTHCTEPHEILDSVEPLTPGQVVLTLGADGCCFRDDGLTHYVPSVEVKAIDTTGAGDTFIAGFIAGLVDGRKVVDCARLGCRVASFAVTGPGSYPRVPLLATIEI